MADQYNPIYGDGDVTLDCDHNNDSTNAKIVFTKDAAATELARIQENGFMGLGTAAPGCKFDAQVSAGSIKARVKTSAANQSADIEADAPGWARILLSRSGSNKWALVNGLAGTDCFSIYSNSASANRMVIDANGNMGVGVDVPKSALQVDGGVQMGADTDPATVDKVGTLRYRADSNNSYLEICIQNSANGYKWEILKQFCW